MNYIITENHLKLILLEQSNNKLTTSMKLLNSFARNIIIKTQKKYDINLRFLLKFGTAIGGLVLPLSDYIKTGNFKLNDEQIALVLVGVASTYFLENAEKIDKIFKKINEDGIYDVFQSVLSKADELKNAFFDFLGSLKTTIDTTVEMISYSFLIPIITDIVSATYSSSDPYTAAKNIFERLIASGVVIVVGTTLNELLSRICSRISERD